MKDYKSTDRKKVGGKKKDQNHSFSISTAFHQSPVQRIIKHNLCLIFFY